MTRISYVDGAYVEHANAVTHIEDRGYQLADGVYEYIAFYNGNFLDVDPHLARLGRSLSLLKIPAPMGWEPLKLVMRELIERNHRTDGAVYLQVTRGIAPRDHAFPKPGTRPILTMTVCAPKLPKPHQIADGAAVITRPDERWKNCDIKSIALLANVMAKQAAVEEGAREVWLTLPDGSITEGSASNAYIVTPKGVITHPADHHILPGISRHAVLKLARENGIGVQERPFFVDEVKAAEEAFITSTSPNVLPIVTIDGHKIGSGKPGEVTKKIMRLYHLYIFKQTGRNFA